MALAFLMGIVSVQAQSFDFDCEPTVIVPEEEGTASHILSYRDVTLNTITGEFIVEGIEFEERDGSRYAPEGWVHPHDGSEFRFHRNESGQGIGFIFNPFDGRTSEEIRSFHINSYESLVDVLLDEFKGPAIFYSGNKLSVNNKYLRGNGEYFETDNGSVYGNLVRGHIKFHLHDGVWDVDLKKNNRDKVYLSNLNFDALENVVRSVSAGFESTYNLLPTVGYDDANKVFWYNSKRWARAENGDDQWLQPNNLKNYNDIDRNFEATRIGADDWVLRYYETPGNYISSRSTFFEMLRSIASLLQTQD